MLKKIRSSPFPAALALLLAGVSLTTSCSKNDAVAPVTAEQQFTGQELFKGLFFLEGPVARKLPYLDAYVSMLDKNRQQDPTLAARKTAQVDKVMQNVMILEPGYLPSLKAAVTSKDFARIDQVLTHGVQLVEAATLLTLDGRQQQQYQQAKSIMAQMDLSKYDFRNDADIQKFTAAVKAQLVDNGSTGSPAQLEDANVLAAVREYAVFFATEIGIVMINTRVSWIVREMERSTNDLSAKASLEKETLIKQIAFNLN